MKSKREIRMIMKNLMCYDTNHHFKYFPDIKFI